MERRERAGRWAYVLLLGLSSVALSFGGRAVAQPATPGPLAADPHLNMVPLSPEDAARARAVIASPQDFEAPQPFETLAAGVATGMGAVDERSFTHPSTNLAGDRRLDFELGKALFDKLWVAAPASTRASDGLGPLYNARACQECHLRDGRGRLPGAEGDMMPGLVLRLSLPAPDADDAAAIAAHLADHTLGRQLQDHAAPGLKAEGRIVLRYTEIPVTLADGTVIPLRAPSYEVADPAGGVLTPGLILSPRLAPPMIGLGLLEAIASADILAGEDPDDRDGDGISGRANMIPSLEFGALVLGRFGWKAGVATVREQTARALSNDMGLSSPLLPEPWGDCTTEQATCRDAPDGEEPGIRDGRELDGQSLDLLAFYARNLAVPARRDVDDPQVLAGKAVFYQAGCPACHRPNFVTARLTDRPEQSFQLIWPYTDLLLHDLGEGLADGFAEGRATGREWRTAPLWGVGLTATVGGGQGLYLHDGRARSLLEAILWHGGEALAARDQVIALPKEERDALISYLESL